MKLLKGLITPLIIMALSACNSSGGGPMVIPSNGTADNSNCSTQLTNCNFVNLPTTTTSMTTMTTQTTSSTTSTATVTSSSTATTQSSSGSQPNISSFGLGLSDHSAGWLVGSGFIQNETVINIFGPAPSQAAVQIPANQINFNTTTNVTFSFTGLNPAILTLLNYNGGINLTVSNGSQTSNEIFMKQPTINQNPDGSPQLGFSDGYPCAIWLVGFNIDNVYVTLRNANTTDSSPPIAWIIDNNDGTIVQNISPYPSTSSINFYVPTQARSEFNSSGLTLSLTDQASGIESLLVQVPADSNCPTQ